MQCRDDNHALSVRSVTTSRSGAWDADCATDNVFRPATSKAMTLWRAAFFTKLEYLILNQLRQSRNHLPDLSN
jgi:hypothetical protein